MTKPTWEQVKWTIGDSIVVFLVTWIGFVVALQIMLINAEPYSAAIQQFNAGLRAGALGQSFVIAAVNAALGLVLVGYYLRRRGASWRDLGLRRFNFWQALMLVFIVYFGFFAIVAIVFAVLHALIPGFNANQEQTNDLKNSTTSAGRALSIIGLAVLPPIVEEIVFRGFMFSVMAKRWGAVVGALVSSGLFAFAHLQVNVSVYTFILGLLLCMMYYKLRSIWPGIFVHALNNYVALMVSLKK